MQFGLGAWNPALQKEWIQCVHPGKHRFDVEFARRFWKCRERVHIDSENDMCPFQKCLEGEDI